MSRVQRSAIAWQVGRKAIQLSAFAFVAYAAISLHWRNFKVAHNSERIVAMMHNDTAGWLYAVNERALSWFGDPLAVSDGLTGMPWAARAGGIPLTDPWTVAAVAAGGAVPPLSLVLGALFPVALAVVLGKVFCSFLCPARVLFEVTSAVRRGLGWLGIALPAWRLPRIGLWVGAAAVAFSIGAGPAIFQLVLPYYAVGVSVATAFTTGAAATTVLWVVGLLAFDLFLAPGQVCSAMCPTGALLEQLGRAPALALVRKAGRCPPTCDLCQRACPYGLFPGHDTHRPACDTCGRCAVACPQQRLAPAIGRPGWRGSAVLLTIGLCLAGAAAAHHNKGLPHYGYFENYPQVPTEEFIEEIGRWEVGAVLFNFQGMDRSSSATPDDVRIFAYAYDLQADRGYRGELSMAVEDAAGGVVGRFDRLQPDQEGVYVFRVTLPASGDYRLVYELEGGHRVELPFDVDLEIDRVPWGLLGGAAAVVGLLFAIALIGRKDRAARRAAPALEVARGP